MINEFNMHDLQLLVAVAQAPSAENPISMVGDEEFRGILEARIKEQQRAAKEQAAEAVIKLFNAADQEIANRVAELREIRRKEAKQLAVIKELTAAKELAASNGNFIALASKVAPAQIRRTIEKLKLD